MKKKLYAILCLLMITCSVILTGCENNTETQSPVMQDEVSSTGYLPGDYDSADTAVIYSIHEEKKQIRFLNLSVYKTYTLTYSGTTLLYDKHRNALSMSQIQTGDIVDITFLKTPKTLTSLTISADSFSQTDVSRVDIDAGKQTIVVGNQTFKFTNHTLLISEGKKIELMDIQDEDVLTIHGIGNQIHSLVVDKGHGYLRLKNDENFIGGWIEVGQSVIRIIEEDMLLVVPEGIYDMTVSKNGVSGTKKISIARNQESEIDIGEFKGLESKWGMVIFTMSPSDAKVYVDGQMVDTDTAISLEYGIHQIIAKAKGYSTLTTYIKVGQASAGIELTLDKKDTDVSDGDEEDSSNVTASDEKNETTSDLDTDNHSQSDENTSDSSEDNPSDTGSNDNQTVSAIAANYKIYVDNPTGFEIYFDGTYKGIAPISFNQELGTHVITIRKDGYITKSYSIVVEDTQSDVTFSFETLEKK